MALKVLEFLLGPLGKRLYRLFERNGFRDVTFGEYRFDLIIAVAIGIAGGYGAVGFREAIHLVERVSFGTGAQEELCVVEGSPPNYELAAPNELDLVEGQHGDISSTPGAVAEEHAQQGFSDEIASRLLSLPWWMLLIIPVIGGLLVGPIVTIFASEAKGHGVPEVMAAVATRGGIIRGRVAAAKVVASAITIGTGGSAGSEGPIVQIGSSISSAIGQFLKVSPGRLKTFVGCGAAAGIAATFNAPVGGMLFAVEIILGEFGMAQLSPIIVSSVVATAISRMHLGDDPAIFVPEYALQSPFELIHYAVLGVIAGVVAVLFTRVLHWTEGKFEHMRFPNILKPALGGLIIGSIGAIGFPHVYGVGYEFIGEALQGDLQGHGGLMAGMSGFWLLALLLFAKIIATSATLGSGGSGGIFAPSLFLGAMVGGMVWFGAEAATPYLVTPNYGAYSLVGMAAVVASTTRAPLQAILILFELTGGYEVILPLMLSSIIAVLIGNWLLEESIYTIKLKAKGILLRKGREVNVLRTITVADVMRTDVHTIPYNMRLRPLLDEISNDTHHSALFILNAQQELHGSISFHEIRSVLFDVEALEPVLVANDIANIEPALVTPEDTLDIVIQLFSHKNQDELPVVDSINRSKLIGSVHRADVISAYNHEIMKRDLLGAASSAFNVAEKVSEAGLAPGYSMAEVELPGYMAGKDLRTLDLRAKEKIEVILVRRHNPSSPSKMDGIVPTPDLILKHGDVILVSGPHDVVTKFAKHSL